MDVDGSGAAKHCPTLSILAWFAPSDYDLLHHCHYINSKDDLDNFLKVQDSDFYKEESLMLHHHWEKCINVGWDHADE